MNDMERRSFEDSFKNAFNGAELQPSETPWTNIELDLSKAEEGAIRRKLVFYKMLAAASISFAVLFAGIGYYFFNNSRNLQSSIIASVEPKNEEKQTSIETEKNHQNVIQEKSLTENSSPTSTLAKPNVPTATYSYNNYKIDVNEFKGRDDGNKLSFFQKNRDKDVLTEPSHNQKNLVNNGEARLLPQLYAAKEIELQFPIGKEEQVADPVALMFAKLEQLEKELAGQDEKKETQKEKLWTSVGFAAGGFDPGSPAVSATPATLANATFANAKSLADNQTKASGLAYSVGVSLGTQVAKKWVLQGGISYLSQVSDYTASGAVAGPNYSVFRAASLNELKAKDTDSQEAKVVSTAPYTVNNSVQFIAVPVQAGYLILNKKIGLILNAGVSTDLFLQNTIDPEGSMEKTTQKRGSDSPYRSVNFSGLLGSEISYKLNNRYIISVNPGLRYPFNSIYKEEIGVDAMPLTFDLGLKFRYNFK